MSSTSVQAACPASQQTTLDDTENDTGKDADKATANNMGMGKDTGHPPQTSPSLQHSSPLQQEGLGALIRRNFPAILWQEMARWSFIVRVIAGALMALGISLFLQLEQPATAMLTVLIIMQPQSGAVLVKSLFRLLGNFAGGIAAVAMYSLLGQEPVLFIAALALWVAFCTVGSARYRNDQSYGFVLAGYTACIIGLPQLGGNVSALVPINFGMVNDISNTAVLRCSEVFVGILCSAVMSETIFRGTVSKILDVAAKGRFTVFDDFVRKALNQEISGEALEAKQLSFISDIAKLDTYGASISFEAAGTMRKERVRLFNTDFMGVSSSFHTLCAFDRYLPPSKDDPSRKFFTGLMQNVSATMTINGKSAATATDAKRVAVALARLQKASRTAIRDFFQQGLLSSAEKSQLRIGFYLLSRFLTDMRSYLMHYAALTDDTIKVRTKRVFFTSHTDKSIALVSGLRAAIVLFLLSLFWFGTASDNGSSSAIFAVVYCALLAAAPNPIKSILLSVTGCLMGVLAGVAFSFLILPHLTEFVTLCLGLIPFLAFGPYLATIPALAGPGRAYNFMFSSFACTGLAISIDPVLLVSGALGKMLGIVVAGSLLAVILPAGGAWWKGRMKKALLREGVRACTKKENTIGPSFDSAIRDILLQFSASPFPSREEKQAMLRQTLAMSSLGRIIIDMRQLLSRNRCPHSEKRLLAPLPYIFARFFANPSLANYSRLLQRIKRTIDILDKKSGDKSPKGWEQGVRLPSVFTAATIVKALQQSLMASAEVLKIGGAND